MEAVMLLNKSADSAATSISKLEIFNKIQDKGNYDAEIHKSAIILPFNFFYKISVLL